jgi:2-polyprenyl-3-methyl-5-hydroxy-6-metoxy-1,4-benzoquinol methylase
MWDERYSAEEYVYGTNPNKFLEANVSSIPKGKVLSLAEGEGRNAVFLAKQGYSVTAVDASLVGLNKAKKFAEENGVVVEFIHANLADYDLGEINGTELYLYFVHCPLQQENNFIKKLKQG